MRRRDPNKFPLSIYPFVKYIMFKPDRSNRYFTVREHVKLFEWSEGEKTWNIFLKCFDVDKAVHLTVPTTHVVLPKGYFPSRRA